MIKEIIKLYLNGFILMNGIDNSEEKYQKKRSV